MCKRNSPDKNEASTGCVRETPHRKMKPAWDVEEKLPRLKKCQRVRESPERKLKQHETQIKIKPAPDV